MKKTLHLLRMVGKFYLYGFIVQLFFTSLILASDIKAQGSLDLKEVKITLNLESVSLIDAFDRINKQTDFYFIYDREDLRNAGTTTLDFRDETMENVLYSLASSFGLSFRQVNERISVKVKKQPNDPVFQASMDILVSGQVVDAAGAPLPGVTVIIDGTSVGTVTDINGNYSLNADPGTVLVFSFVGFENQKITVGNSDVINVRLVEDSQALDEFVVVGYGEVRKSDLTGAVGSVTAEAITRGNPVQAARALQGQVSGVNVNKINSRPGADFTIDIRGLQSIGFSNEPLVVIDGVMGGRLNTLNPSDIESMDVLKDASATAIYGARGANGVIIITTKKGKEGKTRVTYDGYTGVKVPNHLPDMMTAQEFYRAYNDVVKAENPKANPVWTSTELANVEAGRSVDWVDEVTAPAAQMNHVVAISGGNEHTTLYFSTGYLSENGNLAHTGFERYNLKGSVDSKLSNLVKVGFNAYYTYSVQNLGSNEVLRNAFRARPTGSILYSDVLDPAQSSDRDVDGYAFWMGIKDNQVQNPILEAGKDAMQEETRVSSFLGNAYVELTPFKGFSVRSSLSTSVLSNREGRFRNADSKSRLNRLPDALVRNNLNASYTLDNIANYKLATNRHELNVTAVQSAFLERFENYSIDVENLPYNSGWYALNTASVIRGVSSRLTERSILSYMGRVNYIYNDKYLFTVTGRYDGSSVLAQGNKWAFFPSAAVAWRMGDEAFIKNLNLFSDLKLRASYGIVGNDVVPPYSTQANMRQTVYDWDGAPSFGYAPNNIGNSELRWENSEEVNLGVNMGFLQNRITMDVELYHKITNDLIQNVALPTSFGFNAVTANVGKLLNRGIELSLNSVNVQKNDFRWSTNLTFSSNHNEILELYGGTVERDIANSLFVGHSLRSHYFYEFDGIWQMDQAEEALKYGQVPGSVRVVDQNGDGLISSAIERDDRVILGNQLPRWIGGMTNTFNYKNWDLSFFIYTRQGVMFRNSMLSGTFGELGSPRYNRLNLNYWTQENPTNDYFGVWQPNPFRQAIQYKNADFVRLQFITLGYNLPATLLERLKISNARFYIQADNPYFHVSERNIWMDPEFNSGTFQDDVPFSTILLGLNLAF
ncbi:MAG: SusC/RagA family TonB-linked outer membrane protein [Alphaproteobacteria bacterium]|nr:SusC/RagA family TonB-linked outer membrane protein [Alphaproteobacteria bacterium]